MICVQQSATVAPPAASVPWKDVLRQHAMWFHSATATRLADAVLALQNRDGGWGKNVDPAAQSAADPETAAASTIDNGATWTHLLFLARVASANGEERFQKGFLRGLDYLLAAQYPNGGWPQYFPLRKGYYTHITFNDGAMIGVLELLRAVARGGEEYRFVDAGRRERSALAVQKGITCILRCQVLVRGKRTAWCAQHDETTFAPAPARAYEKVSLSGSESVGVVRFLMGIDKPDASVRTAVEDAIRWFESARLSGLRYEKRTLTADPAAPSLWARFYELETNRPIFSGRDGVVRYSLAEIEKERRDGYSWYTTQPQALLTREYPAWRLSLTPPLSFR